MGLSVTGSEDKTRDELRLLADPKELKRRLDQFDKAKAEAQKFIELVGPAKQILALRKSAQQEHDKQKSLTAKVQSDYDARIAEAEAQAESIVANAKAEAGGIVDEANQLRDQAQRDFASVKADQQAAADARAAAESVKLDLDRDRAAFDAARDAALSAAERAKGEYEVEVARLRGIATDLKALLKQIP